MKVENIGKEIMLVGCMILMAGTFVYAEEINLEAIKQIESSGNPNAFNPISQAVGLYQITPICLKDYNLSHPGREISFGSLANPALNEKVAAWYITVRIPQLLKHYSISDSITNRLIAYNAGIKTLRSGFIPQETKKYLKKYRTLN